MQNIFYVYVLFRPNGQPCYVGKGFGRRSIRHSKKSRNCHLNRIIEQAGGELPCVRVREHLSEQEAFETEIALIAALGRQRDGGILANMTLGGEGTHGHKVVLTPQQLANLSASLKLVKNTPEFKAAQSVRTKTYFLDPEVKERHRAGLLAAFARPEVRANREADYARRRGQKISAKQKELLRQHALVRMATPEAKAAIAESNRRRKGEKKPHSDAHRAAMAVAQQRRWVRYRAEQSQITP